MTLPRSRCTTTEPWSRKRMAIRSTSLNCHKIDDIRVKIEAAFPSKKLMGEDTAQDQTLTKNFLLTESFAPLRLRRRTVRPVEDKLKRPQRTSQRRIPSQLKKLNLFSFLSCIAVEVVIMFTLRWYTLPPDTGKLLGSPAVQCTDRPTRNTTASVPYKVSSC